MHIYQWLNLKNKINKEAEQKQTHRYKKHSDDCQMGGELGEKGEEIKKDKLVVME